MARFQFDRSDASRKPADILPLVSRLYEEWLASDYAGEHPTGDAATDAVPWMRQSLVPYNAPSRLPHAVVLLDDNTLKTRNAVAATLNDRIAAFDVSTLLCTGANGRVQYVTPVQTGVRMPHKPIVIEGKCGLEQFCLPIESIAAQVHETAKKMDLPWYFTDDRESREGYLREIDGFQKASHKERRELFAENAQMSYDKLAQTYVDAIKKHLPSGRVVLVCDVGQFINGALPFLLSREDIPHIAYCTKRSA